MSAIAQTFEDVSVLDLAALRRMTYAELFFAVSHQHRFTQRRKVKTQRRSFLCVLCVFTLRLCVKRCCRR